MQIICFRSILHRLRFIVSIHEEEIVGYLLLWEFYSKYLSKKLSAMFSLSTTSNLFAKINRSLPLSTSCYVGTKLNLSLFSLIFHLTSTSPLVPNPTSPLVSHLPSNILLQHTVVLIPDCAFVLTFDRTYLFSVLFV